MIEISVDLQKTVKKMKPLHGICNGPLSRGGSNDTSFFYKRLSPPYARLHDTNYPISMEVDVHNIFPDMGKSADNPENYDFRLTDIYIDSILKLGTGIIYRLGESIAPAINKKYVAPPEDYEKYAKICTNIIRHYNDGWAGGFNHGLKFWEIWNEPNVSNMWTGTQKQWLEMYAAVARRINEYNPDLMIGGPVACNPNSPINEPFFQYVVENGLPLDFYSFHCYTNSRAQAVSFLETARERLARYGLSHLPSFITEWNYAPKGPDGKVFWDYNPKASIVEKAAMFERINNEEGASHVAMFLSLLQDSFVEQANYYQASTDGLFSCFTKYGLPQKTYYSLLAFKELYDLGKQIEVKTSDEPGEASAIAASDGKTVRILISNFDSPDEEFLLKVPGIPSQKCLLRTIDSERNLDKSTVAAGPVLNMNVKRRSVVLIEMKA